MSAQQEPAAFSGRLNPEANSYIPVHDFDQLKPHQDTQQEAPPDEAQVSRESQYAYRIWSRSSGRGRGKRRSRRSQNLQQSQRSDHHLDPALQYNTSPPQTPTTPFRQLPAQNEASAMYPNNQNLQNKGYVSQESSANQYPPIGANNDNIVGQTTQDSGSCQNQHGRVTSEPTTANTSILGNEQTPVYGQAVTWKSDKFKSQEEYHRTSQRVRAIAPEMLKDKAKPIGRPANIFPRNTTEWIDFKADRINQRLDEVNQSVDLMKGQVEAAVNMEQDGVPRPTLSPAFGDEPGQKDLVDGRSTVLAQPTIWSNNNPGSGAGWPARAELLSYGDNRPIGSDGMRVDRSLPPPRFPAQYPGMSFHQQQPVSPFPFDVPSASTAAEAETTFNTMNDDPAFQAKAMRLLGGPIMGEIGPLPPQTPNTRRAVCSGEMCEDEKMVRAYAAANGAPIPMEYQYEGRDKHFGSDDVLFVAPNSKLLRFRFAVGWLPQ